MQLKILIVPVLIILALVFGIGFIKPDYDTLTQKKALLAEKQSQVSKIETVKTNISALTQDLDSKGELEQFVLRYYPETMDQERVIDSFNFMATQSGLVIDSMDMKEVVSEKKEESLGVGGPLTSVPGDTAAMPPVAGMMPASMYHAPSPGSFVAQVKAKGSYENIKSFLNRLSRMDRMNSVITLSVDTDTKQAATQEEDTDVAPTEQLVGTFEARFDYLKNKEGQNALNVPVFGGSALSTTKLEEAKTWASSAVPALSVEQSGRANPFQ